MTLHYAINTQKIRRKKGRRICGLLRKLLIHSIVKKVEEIAISRAKENNSTALVNITAVNLDIFICIIFLYISFKTPKVLKQNAN